MKKWIAICLLLILAFSSAGCSRQPAQTVSVSVPTEAPEQAQAELPISEQEPEEATQAGITEEAPETEAQKPVLVVYFSATGTTRGVAERIAALTGGELAEIVPAQPYTAEDLNYNDRETRATVEQNTPDARPEIAEDISLAGYTTVYLG